MTNITPLYGWLLIPEIQKNYAKTPFSPVAIWIATLPNLLFWSFCLITYPKEKSCRSHMAGWHGCCITLTYSAVAHSFRQWHLRQRPNCCPLNEFLSKHQKVHGWGWTVMTQTSHHERQCESAKAWPHTETWCCETSLNHGVIPPFSTYICHRHALWLQTEWQYTSPAPCAM